MRVEIIPELRSPRAQDKYTQIMSEAVEYMSTTERINPLNPRDMEDMVADVSLFKKYLGKLCEGMGVESKGQLVQLAANSYRVMFGESTTSSMAPLSVLTLPMLRRAWPKIGIKNAIPTEVAKQPVFKKNTIKPFVSIKEPVQASGGTRKIFELPGDPTTNSIRDIRKRFKKTTVKRIGRVQNDGFVTVSGVKYAPSELDSQAAVVADDNAVDVDGTEKTFTVPGGYTHDQVNGYTISPDIGILGVELEYWDTAEVATVAEERARKAAAADGSGIAAQLRTVRLPLGFRGELRSAVSGEKGKYMTLSVVDKTLSGDDGTRVYSNPKARFHPETGGLLLNLKFTVDSLTSTSTENVSAEGGIMAIFERGAWRFIGNSLHSASPNQTTKGTIKITKVFLDGAIETTQNKNATQVGFTIDTRNIEIPTGEHIEGNLSLEWLHDTLAMYNIDGVLQVTTIISDIIVEKVDIEGFEFIESAFEGLAAQLEQGRSSDGGAKIVSREFDVHPPARFNGQVNDWINSELKRIIDNLAATLIDMTYESIGTFVLVGNPVNMNLLTVSQWHHVEGDENEDGVATNYSVGELQSGTRRYRLFSSQNIDYNATDASGDVNALWLFFSPAKPDYKTLCYFPYTFNVTRSSDGWVSSNNPNVPALMMTKRHKFEEFWKMFGKIKILNNTGTSG